MSGIQRNRTLLENVPALAMLASTQGSQVKLVRIANDTLNPNESFDQPAILLSQGTVLIGRDRGCDVVLDDPRISRTHAKITLEASGAFSMRALGSNGTYINGVRVDDVQMLNAGDEIWFCRDHVYRLVVDQEMARPLTIDEPGLADEFNEFATAVRPPQSFSAVPPETTQPRSAVPERRPSTDDLPVANSAEALRRQRDVLAILYQLSLRCMQAEDLKQADSLLTNVLRRIAPTRGGFIAHRQGDGFRIIVAPCPAPPTVEQIRAASRRCLKLTAPALLDGDSLADESFGAGTKHVVMAPMFIEGESCGALCCFFDAADPFEPHLAELVEQLAIVAAIALASKSNG
ncbi:MAG: FHA domain-containing protein [Deltaproteobacteria bacterium]|nr:FHA domain-containing protein [Deltaproteobacteria bacterium]